MSEGMDKVLIDIAEAYKTIINASNGDYVKAAELAASLATSIKPIEDGTMGCSMGDILRIGATTITVDDAINVALSKFIRQFCSNYDGVFRFDYVKETAINHYGDRLYYFRNDSDYGG